MKRLLFLLILLPFICHSQKVVLSYPTHTIIYDKQLKEPIYAVYEFNRDVTGFHYRNTTISRDMQLERNEQGSFKDYAADTIYDRGHLVPRYAFSDSKSNLYFVNKYSNILPQHKELNRNQWRMLEFYISSIYYNTGHTVKVFVGQDVGYRLLGRLKIPTYFWCLIRYNGIYEAWIMPNKDLGNVPLWQLKVDASIVKAKINSIGFDVIN